MKSNFGFHPAFAVAAGGMVISVLILWWFRAHVDDPQHLKPAATDATAVKTGLGRYSVRNKPPKVARQMIEDAAKRALTSPTRTKPYVPARPTTITIDLGTVDSAAQFMGRSGVEIVEPLKVVSKGEDWMQAWDQIWKW